jgi:DNA-binding HxlR family transcriptional regulator
MHKTYGQFCALARALDHVGDRWTLLIIRELLLGPGGFRQLEQALPGIAPSLLVDRLGRLEADGLLRRNDAPARSKSVQYTLTPAGEALEAALLELIRWGARWMSTGPGADVVDPRWATLALRALLEGSVDMPGSTRVRLDVEGNTLSVETIDRMRSVTADCPEGTDARIRISFPELLAVASGAVTLDETSAAIEGDRQIAYAALGLYHAGRPTAEPRR